MSVGRSGMRADAVPVVVLAPLANRVSSPVVVPVPWLRLTMVRAGWVVVLAFAVNGLHAPPFARSHRPATAGTPQSLSRAQLPLHEPATPLPMPPPGQFASSWQAPFWNTPVGPTGDAQVLVT